MTTSRDLAKEWGFYDTRDISSRHPTRQKLLEKLTTFKNEHPYGAINTSALARELHVRRQAIDRHYHKLQVDYPLPPKLHGGLTQLMPDQLALLRQEVERQVAAGKPMYQIADDLKIPQRWLRQMKWLQIRERVWLEQKTVIRALRRQGLGGREICKRTGISRGRVERLTSELVQNGEIPRMRNRKTK